MNTIRNSLVLAILVPSLSGCAAVAATMAAPVATAEVLAQAPNAYSTPVAQAERTAVSTYPQAPTTAGPSEGYRPTPTPRPSEGEGNRPNVNPFIETSVDHLSTFALDVDTASYTRPGMRFFPECFRIPNPCGWKSSSITSGRITPLRRTSPLPSTPDAAPSPFHPDGSYLMRVGVKGYEVPDEMRKPLVLTFVIDVSGSMGYENKLEMVKDSLALLAGRLRPSDSVAIVAYSTDAWVVLEATNGYDRQKIVNAVYALSPHETTNVEAGLRLGYQLAWQAFRPEASNRVILCSDGVANEGVTDPNGILDYVHGYTELGITLTVIGVGLSEYNDALLEQLADKGDGQLRLCGHLRGGPPRAGGGVGVHAAGDRAGREDPGGFQFRGCRALPPDRVREPGPSPTRISATTRSTPERSAQGHTATALYAVQFRAGRFRSDRHDPTALGGSRRSHRPGDQRQLQHLGPDAEFR